MPQYDDFVIVICKDIHLRSVWFLNFIVVAFKLICTPGKQKESLKRVFFLPSIFITLRRAVSTF